MGAECQRDRARVGLLLIVSFFLVLAVLELITMSSFGGHRPDKYATVIVDKFSILIGLFQHILL